MASAESVSFSDAFGALLTDIADLDERVLAITAAMKEGTGLACFAERFPERFYDVGIAEQHAVTFAAGLATRGLRPVVAIYSTFLQRAYDQIVHDVCIQNLPVIFAIDRAGIVGEDGATHQGVFDISFLRPVPNLVIMAPRDMVEMKQMIAFALTLDGPSAIRYPRGKVPRQKAEELTVGGARHSPLEMGRAEILLRGDDLAILAVGNTVHPAIEAARLLEREGIGASVVDARFIKPLDGELILSLARDVRRILTVEETALAGGFGSAVVEVINDAGLSDVLVKRIGVADVFVEHGSQGILKKRYGLDAEGIYRRAVEFLEISHPQRDAGQVKIADRTPEKGGL